jgi:hypothetical protein
MLPQFMVEIGNAKQVCSEETKHKGQTSFIIQSCKSTNPVRKAKALIPLGDLISFSEVSGV